MEHVWSLQGPRCAAVGVMWFWLVIVMIAMMVGDGNGIGVNSDRGLIKVWQGWLVAKTDTEQWARWPSLEAPSEPSYDCSLERI